MTNGDPAGFSCEQQRTCVLCMLYRCQAITATTDRQSDFHYRCSLFPLGESTRLDTHTQTHSVTAVSMNTASISGIRLQYAPVFPALHAIFKRLFKASCFPTVSLNNSGVSRVTNFSANTTAQLLSRLADDRQIKVPLSLSRPS